MGNRKLTTIDNIGLLQVHCEFCRRGFRSTNDLYKHKTRLHAKEAGLRNGYVAECPHCQRKFTDLGSAYRDLVVDR